MHLMQITKDQFMKTVLHWRDFVLVLQFFQL